MKKTFKELLNGKKQRFDWNPKRVWVDYADVLQLLKQVAEAKLKEAEDACESTDNETRGRIAVIDTDSIIVE